jgi:hypothetical protein
MKHFSPDVVKMDIEGDEADALRGAENVIDHARAWIIEVHGLEQEHECMAVLTAFGYRTNIVLPRRWLPDKRPIAHNRWIVAYR